jgi:hypothetical protein
MILWIEWYECIQYLHAACSRTTSAMWMTLCIAAFCCRYDMGGVTSFVRVLGLQDRSYKSMLNCFHSPAIKLDKLTDLWCNLVLKCFTPLLLKGRIVLVGDGIKVAKEGRKMPAVKKLHQESQDNAKSEYIFGHSLQALALLVAGPFGKILAVPLISRIHEGIRFSPKDKRTLLDKFATLFTEIAQRMAQNGCYLVADAYYASRKVITPLLTKGHHLICRVRSNAVAYYPAPPKRIKSRGRKKIYGEKVKLGKLFKEKDQFVEATATLYGKATTIRYRTLDLLWRPIGVMVRFVLVIDPSKGKSIFLCTDLSLTAIEIITAYSWRFKIEAAFKQAVYTIGAYTYHFWMQMMTPSSRSKSGDVYLHRESKEYRQMVTRKIDAYHRFIQFGCIAQGMLQYLSVCFGRQVWDRFGSWMRTMNTSQAPSEAVVATALRNCLPEFLLDSPEEHTLKKFILDRIDLRRFWPFGRAA